MDALKEKTSKYEENIDESRILDFRPPRSAALRQAVVAATR